MAYSPVEQGCLVAHPGLAAMAAEHAVSPAQLALAWLLARPGILPIPKAGSVAHVRDNRAALDLKLSEGDLRRLDELFPPPRGPEPLAML
jgi:diketogulonate reductase-like aldo/keto reductase